MNVVLSQCFSFTASILFWGFCWGGGGGGGEEYIYKITDFDLISFMEFSWFLKMCWTVHICIPLSNLTRICHQGKGHLPT